MGVDGQKKQTAAPQEEKRENRKLRADRQNKRATGAVYERAVRYYLEQQGYEILDCNYRCPLGEIDIIAKEGGYLVFCEVKYRKNSRKGNPLEAVDRRKQQTIFRCAQWYLNSRAYEKSNRGTDLSERYTGDIPCRFDVIGVEGSQITLVKNAFEGA